MMAIGDDYRTKTYLPREYNRKVLSGIHTARLFNTDEATYGSSQHTPLNSRHGCMLTNSYELENHHLKGGWLMLLERLYIEVHEKIKSVTSTGRWRVLPYYIRITRNLTQGTVEAQGRIYLEQMEGANEY